MRRALAAALLGISLWIGSLAWTGFLLTRTALDPERSERIAEALYEDEAVRARLAENVADGVQASLPDGIPVQDSAVDAGAARVLDSPAVEALFVDAFVRTHRAMLGDGEVPRSIDPGALGAAGRESLVADRPELDGVLPAAPELAVALPTDRIPDLGPLRRGLLTAVPVLAAASAVGVVLALLISSNRPAVIRRAGIWAVTLSAFVLAFAYGIPALAARFVPEQSEVVAALVSAMAAETRVPAITLAALGAGGIVLSLLWRATPALLTEPAPGAQRRSRRRAPRLVGGPPRRPPRDIPVPARPTSHARPQHPRPELDADATRIDAPGSRPEPGGAGVRALGARPEPDATRIDAPAARPEREVARADEPMRWVAGVGWVLQSGEHIPAEARWVPGVGYVVEER